VDVEHGVARLHEWLLESGTAAPKRRVAAREPLAVPRLSPRLVPAAEPMTADGPRA
jgi:hypothetical protein